GAHIAPNETTTAPASAPQRSNAAAPGLHLNPPKLPTPGEKKRSPSLFERITESVQEHLEGFGVRPDIAQPKERKSPSPVSQGGYAPQPQQSAPQQPQQTQPQPQPAQGSLNIGAPAKPAAAQSDDELDIPAFLRRQAN
ncbi:MAG: hypothetical protein ACPGRX_06675, partial [Bdellovibrionales bacterium]